MKPDYFSLKNYPFSSLAKGPTKLPYIPKEIEENDSIIQKNISILTYDANLPPINYNYYQNRRNKRNSILNYFHPKKREGAQFKTLNPDNSYHKINNDSSFNLLSNPKHKNQLQKLRNDLKTSNNNYSGIFLTNISQRLTTENSISYNNSSFSLSRSSSGKKGRNKNLLSYKNREDLVKSLDFINNEIHEKYKVMKDTLDDAKDYEKFMIKKCDNVLNYYDKKYKISSDEFLNEKIEKIKTEGLNYKFNRYFDKLISQKKEFNYVLINKLLKERTEKHKLAKIVNEQKLEKQRGHYFKVIERNLKEAKKFEMLSDFYIKKNKKTDSSNKSIQEFIQK